MNQKGMLAIIISAAAAAYAVIAVWQWAENAVVTCESLVLLLILVITAAFAWTGDRTAGRIVSKKNAALWIAVMLFVVYGLLKAGGLI